MISLCPYKNALGVPNQGVHKHWMGFAIMDIIMTILGAIVLSYLFLWDFWRVLLILFLLGIILHRIFCVRTTIDKILFPNAE